MAYAIFSSTVTLQYIFNVSLFSTTVPDGLSGNGSTVRNTEDGTKEMFHEVLDKKRNQHQQ